MDATRIETTTIAKPIEKASGTEMERPGPFAKSCAVEKLQARKDNRQPLRMAFLDIDSTVTGDREKANQIRDKLEEKGYVVVFITSRTEEMVISQEEQNRSPELGRPAAQLEIDTNTQKRIIADPKDKEPAGLIDADIVAGSTGSRIMIKQAEGGYRLDQDFEEKMKAESKSWRQDVFKIIDRVNGDQALAQAIPIEFAEKYQAGLTDVFPPEFRLQVNFPNAEAETQFREQLTKLKTTEKLKWLAEGIDPAIVTNLSNIRMTDDSKPPDRFSAYLTPSKGNKARAMEEIIENTCNGLDISREDLEILIAGDSFPDLGMGLYGGLNTDATFLLASGSRLTKPLIDQELEKFGNEGLSAIKRRLGERGQGNYSFKPPLFRERKVIVGNEAYPGKNNQESILAFLESVD